MQIQSMDPLMFLRFVPEACGTCSQLRHIGVTPPDHTRLFTNLHVFTALLDPNSAPQTANRTFHTSHRTPTTTTTETDCSCIRYTMKRILPDRMCETCRHMVRMGHICSVRAEAKCNAVPQAAPMYSNPPQPPNVKPKKFLRIDKLLRELSDLKAVVAELKHEEQKRKERKQKKKQQRKQKKKDQKEKQEKQEKQEDEDEEGFLGHVTQRMRFRPSARPPPRPRASASPLVRSRPPFRVEQRLFDMLSQEEPRSKQDAMFGMARD